MGIGRPQGPPKGPENGPRGPPHGPSGSQNGPKRPQEDGPKRDPIGPQGSPKRALRRPNKESPKRAPRDLSPRGPCECHDSRLVIVLFAAWPCRRHDLKLAPRAAAPPHLLVCRASQEAREMWKPASRAGNSSAFQASRQTSARWRWRSRAPTFVSCWPTPVEANNKKEAGDR